MNALVRHCSPREAIQLGTTGLTPGAQHAGIRVTLHAERQVLARWCSTGLLRAAINDGAL